MTIKFVKYEAKPYAYCDGVCTLNIDGKDYTFGPRSKKTDFPKFWSSGGYYDIETGDTVQLPWVKNEYNDDLFPKELLAEMPTMLMLFNENVSYGCCGACL